MAPYDVNLVCWRVVHDKEFYDAILKNPAEAIRDCGLTEAERVALFDQDARVSLQASTPAPVIKSISACRCLRSPLTRQGMSQAAGAKTEGTETDKTRSHGRSGTSPGPLSGTLCPWSESRSSVRRGWSS